MLAKEKNLMPEFFAFLTVAIFVLACQGMLGLCQHLMETK
jgi:hypothetical protein